MSHKTIATFNALHLGDNLVHLHFLRKLAQAYPEIHFTHGAPDQHLAQLYPLWQDIPNLTVKTIAEVGQGAINAWCGAGGWWYQQPTTQDWCRTYIRWMDELSKLMGLENPIREPGDMLMDYPALNFTRSITHVDYACDFLIVNSPPRSGQFQSFNAEAFQNLAGWLAFAKSKLVVTTAPTGIDEVPCTQAQSMDVTAIGRFSVHARCIIGCVTGPMWPTLNIWNRDTVALRVHLQDREHVNMIPGRTVHVNHLSLVPEILKDRGLL